MSKETTLVALGVWVIVLPFLGIPRGWLTALLVVTGLGVIAVGLLLRAEALSRGPGRHHAHNHFVEHLPQQSDHEHHERKERINSLN